MIPSLIQDTMTDPRPSATSPIQKVVDIVLGVAVMGTVGTFIGINMGGGIMPVSIAVGLLMGAVVGYLGGRRFLVSILIGTVLGGILAWVVAGEERISVGAGAGAAMGGFLGVQISMLLDMRAARRASVEPVSSASEETPRNTSS